MTTMNNEDPADPSVHEPRGRDWPEPVAWARNLADPQPHCVTSLSYRSVADADANVRYEPLYTADQMREAIAAERATHRAPLATAELPFTLREATELLAFFGESQTDVTVRLMPAGAVRDEDGSTYDSPAGLWAHCTEYPEEGLFYLGPVDSTEDYAPPAKLELQRSNAARDVLAERRRQVEVEGWTPEHDDEYSSEELAFAAACYATAEEHDAPPAVWPWGNSWWKPKDRRRNMVRAAALLLAGIERLDRAAPR